MTQSLLAFDRRVLAHCETGMGHDYHEFSGTMKAMRTLGDSPDPDVERTEIDVAGHGADAGPIPLRIEYTRLNSFFADYTRNLSKGSTFVKTERPLGVGTKFLFAFHLPNLPFPLPRTKTKVDHAEGEPHVLPLLGVVRWVTSPKQSGADKPAGMGIEFLFSDDHERGEIHAFVARLMEHVLGAHLSAKLLVETPR